MRLIKKHTTSILLTLPLLTTPTVSEDGKWDAGIRISSLGIQGEVAYLFNKTFALRLQAGGYNHYMKEIEYDNVKYHDVKYRPRVATLYADWYFLKCYDWLRLSTGVSYNKTKIKIHQDFSNYPFPSNMVQILKASYKYKNTVAPYLGLGVDIRKIFDSNFIFSFDVGVSYFGSVKAKTVSSGPANNVPQIMNAAKDGAEKLLNDKWWVKWFPVASIGLKYQF